MFQILSNSYKYFVSPKADTGRRHRVVCQVISADSGGRAPSTNMVGIQINSNSEIKVNRYCLIYQPKHQVFFFFRCYACRIPLCKFKEATLVSLPTATSSNHASPPPQQHEGHNPADSSALGEINKGWWGRAGACALLLLLLLIIFT